MSSTVTREKAAWDASVQSNISAVMNDSIYARVWQLKTGHITTLILCAILKR